MKIDPNANQDLEDDTEVKTCKEKISPYVVINPKSRYKIFWDIFMTIVYLTCYVIDPLLYALSFDPLIYSPSWNRFQRLLTWLIVIRMVLEPFTAVQRNEIQANKEDGDDEKVKIRKMSR